MGTYYTYDLFVERATEKQLAEIHTYLAFRKLDFSRVRLEEPWTDGYRSVEFRSADKRARHDRQYESVGEGGSWNDQTEAMMALSKEFQTVRFCVQWADQGGCDPEARSQTYWKNGKYQECSARLTYPPYNPRKLKAPKKRKEVAA